MARNSVKAISEKNNMSENTSSRGPETANKKVLLGIDNLAEWTEFISHKTRKQFGFMSNLFKDSTAKRFVAPGINKYIYN